MMIHNRITKDKCLNFQANWGKYKSVIIYFLYTGDPQQTVQIQVLNPGLLQAQQQQPKYQMQIPIQGFQQGNNLWFRHVPLITE